MKLEYILGKYYADGVEITANEYNNYTNSLDGKYIDINVVQDESSENLKVQELEEKIDSLTKLVNELLKKE